MMKTNRLLPEEKYRRLLQKMRKNVRDIMIANPNTPVVQVQREISHTFYFILQKLVEEALKEDNKSPPCKFAVFVGGSLGRMEASLYSDVDFGILVEKRDKNTLPYFEKFSDRLCHKIQSVGEENGFRPDDNFSPPHTSIQSRKSSNKDFRGTYFLSETNRGIQSATSNPRIAPSQSVASVSENSSSTESIKYCNSVELLPLEVKKRGNSKLIDTADGLSAWQKLDKLTDVGGAAVLSANLRETHLIYGDEGLYNLFVSKTRELISKNRIPLYNQMVNVLRKNLYKLPSATNLKNTLDYDFFPLVFDLKEEIQKHLYLMIHAEALMQKVEINNSFERIKRLRVPDFFVDSKAYETFLSDLTFYYDFIFRLRLKAQLHYKMEYEKILGIQVLRKEMKKYKDRFLQKPPSVSTPAVSADHPTAAISQRANLEWYYKALFDIKAYIQEREEQAKVAQYTAQKRTPVSNPVDSPDTPTTTITITSPTSPTSPTSFKTKSASEFGVESEGEPQGFLEHIEKELENVAFSDNNNTNNNNNNNNNTLSPSLNSGNSTFNLSLNSGSSGHISLNNSGSSIPLVPEDNKLKNKFEKILKNIVSTKQTSTSAPASATSTTQPNGTLADESFQGKVKILEQQLNELREGMDSEHYFLANDQNAVDIKTKPLTSKDITHLKEQLEEMKKICSPLERRCSFRKLCEDFYQDSSMADSLSEDMDFDTVEKDIHDLLKGIRTSKSLVEINPLVLTESEVSHLENCITFIRNSVTNMV